MSGIKDFFLAGIMMEEAREARETARTEMRRITAERCPDELAAYDKATDVLTASEKHFAEVVTSLMSGSHEAMTRQAMIDHAATCDNANCAIKASLSTQTKVGAN